jgi:hypothetical protein
MVSAFRQCLSLGLLALAAAQALGDDRGAASSFDLAGFGRLPVRFNGRVTDFTTFARNALLRISERPIWVDDSGREHLAVEWLLDVATGNERSRQVPIVRIDDDEVRQLLGLPRVADAKQDAAYASIAALSDHMPALQSRLEEARSRTGSLSAGDRGVLRLAERVQTASLFLDTFRLPDFSQENAALLALEQVRQLQQQAIPYCLPPKAPGENWQTLQYAAILKAVGGEAGVAPNPAADLLIELLAAYAANDAARFDAAVAKAAIHAQTLELTSAPYQYDVPSGWVEEGIIEGTPGVLFSDALAVGETVTALRRTAGGDAATIRVNYFPGPTASSARIINDWRSSSSLLPVADAERLASRSMVAGGDAWKVDLSSPDGGPGRGSRTIGVGLVRDGRTWIATLSGPGKLVGQWAPDFDRFLQSLTIGPAAALGVWFPIPVQGELTTPIPGLTLLATVEQVRNTTGVVQVLLLDDDLPDERERELQALVESIRVVPAGDPSAAAPELPFSWSLPEGWKLTSVVDGLPTLSIATPAGMREAVVQSFEAADGDALRRLVDHWRENQRLPRMTDDEAAVVLRQAELPGRMVWWVKYRTPSAPAVSGQATPP